MCGRGDYVQLHGGSVCVGGWWLTRKQNKKIERQQHRRIRLWFVGDVDLMNTKQQNSIILTFAISLSLFLLCVGKFDISYGARKFARNVGPNWCRRHHRNVALYIRIRWRVCYCMIGEVAGKLHLECLLCIRYAGLTFISRFTLYYLVSGFCLYCSIRLFDIYNSPSMTQPRVHLFIHTGYHHNHLFEGGIFRVFDVFRDLLKKKKRILPEDYKIFNEMQTNKWHNDITKEWKKPLRF